MKEIVMNLNEQIELLTNYAKLMLERKDYHALWDAAIDLQRLQDKIELEKQNLKGNQDD